jgi:hypothetical protein
LTFASCFSGGDLAAENRQAAAGSGSSEDPVTTWEVW